MTVSEKARLYRELAKMLNAGFHMDRSVELLIGQRPSRGIRRFLHGVRRGFAQRQSLATAVREQVGSQVSGLEMSLLDSGEVSGRLGQACQHLSYYFETSLKGIREARGALIYPLIILHLGIVVPAFAKHTMMGALDQLKPKAKGAAPAADVVMEIATQLVLFWGALLLLWVVWRTLVAMARRSEIVDRVLGMIPLIGSVRRHWAMARFCQVFHSGLLAAMRISECLHMAGEASQSGTLRKGTLRAQQKVLLGEQLSHSLRPTGAFPRFFVDSIGTAEAAGGMDVEMQRWAASETESAVTAQRRAAEWYPKTLYFLVMGYAGWRVVTLFQTVMGGMTSVLER
jgi:type II secretory pathway component PulF